MFVTRETQREKKKKEEEEGGRRREGVEKKKGEGKVMEDPDLAVYDSLVEPECAGEIMWCKMGRYRSGLRAWRPWEKSSSRSS